MPLARSSRQQRDDRTGGTATSRFVASQTDPARCKHAPAEKPGMKYDGDRWSPLRLEWSLAAFHAQLVRSSVRTHRKQFKLAASAPRRTRFRLHASDHRDTGRPSTIDPEA